MKTTVERQKTKKKKKKKKQETRRTRKRMNIQNNNKSKRNVLQTIFKTFIRGVNVYWTVRLKKMTNNTDS